MALSCCPSCVIRYQDERARRNKSRKIDKQLATDRKALSRTIKILVLGTDESGKRTFLKQMRLVNGHQELKLNRQIIYENIVCSMKVLIDAHRKLLIELERDESQQLADFVFGFDNNMQLEESVFQQYVPAIARLWTDGGTQKAFERRHEYQLGDSVKYFLDNLDRIGQMNYVPTNLDILHAIRETNFITEHELIIHETPLLFVHVGGYRSQRKKWYQHFDSVKSILFLVSSIEFDQVMYQDPWKNRLVESCNYFEEIVNNKAFVDASIILFLTQIDELAVKVRHSSIEYSFPKFTGDPYDIEQVQQFELALFSERRMVRTKPLFHHFTTAPDTENINFVLQAVRDTIFHDMIAAIGMY